METTHVQGDPVRPITGPGHATAARNRSTLWLILAILLIMGIAWAIWGGDARDRGTMDGHPTETMDPATPRP